MSRIIQYCSFVSGLFHLLCIMSSEFIHIIACIRIFFLLRAELYSIVCIYHSVFLCLSVGEYLASPFGYCEQCCHEYYIYVPVWVLVNSFGHIPRSEIAGSYDNSFFFFFHIVILYLAFWGTFKLFSTMAALFYNPPVIRKCSSSFTSLPMLFFPPFIDNEVKWSLFSRVQLFATPWTLACQAPPPLGFSRQEKWRGLPISFFRVSSWPSD